jgi:hypothetical protein
MAPYLKALLLGQPGQLAGRVKPARVGQHEPWLGRVGLAERRLVELGCGRGGRAGRASGRAAGAKQECAGDHVVLFLF